MAETPAKLNLRVLVVDDHETDAEAAAEVLQRIGCACRLRQCNREQENESAGKYFFLWR